MICLQNPFLIFRQHSKKSKYLSGQIVGQLSAYLLVLRIQDYI